MKKIFLIIFIFIMFGFLKAQKKCGTDEIYQIRLQNPIYLQNYLKAKQEIYNYIQPIQKTNCIKEIKVWVHVIYGDANTAPNSKISTSQVVSQMNVLNKDYKALNIEFTLAGYDYYFDNTLTMHDWTTEERQLKSINVKDQTKYLNIWVVQSIDNDAYVGYSSFPWEIDKALDGVVIENKSFGNNGTVVSPYNLGKSVTHEIGHYLGLFHTFEGGCSGTTPATCSMGGDQVCDTPSEAQENRGCPSIEPNTCTDYPDDYNDPIHNYMDYSDDICRTEFTAGQISRIEANIALYRSALYTEDCNLNKVNINWYTACTDNSCDPTNPEFWDPPKVIKITDCDGFDITGENIYKWEIRILNKDGSEILSKTKDVQPNSPTYKIWNGEKNNGDKVGSGKYPFVLVVYDNGGNSQKIVGTFDLSNCRKKEASGMRIDLFGEDNKPVLDKADAFMDKHVCKSKIIFNSYFYPLYRHRDEFYKYVDTETPFKKEFKSVVQQNNVFFNDAFLGPKPISTPVTFSTAKTVNISLLQLTPVLNDAPLGRLQPRHIRQMKHLLTLLIDSAKIPEIKEAFEKILCSSDQWVGLSLKDAILQVDQILSSTNCLYQSHDKITLCHIPQGNANNSQTITIDSSALAVHLRHGDFIGKCVMPATELLTPIETSIVIINNKIFVNYYLYNPARVEINLYNIATGDLIQVLDNTVREESSNYIELNPANYSKGIYIVEFLLNGEKIKKENLIIQ